MKNLNPLSVLNLLIKTLNRKLWGIKFVARATDDHFQPFGLLIFLCVFLFTFLMCLRVVLGSKDYLGIIVSVPIACRLGPGYSKDPSASPQGMEGISSVLEPGRKDSSSFLGSYLSKGLRAGPQFPLI